METLVLSAKTPPNPLRRASLHRPPQSLRFRRCIVAAEAENLTSETAKTAITAKTPEPKPKSENRMFFLGMGYAEQMIAAGLKKKGWDIERAYRDKKTRRMHRRKGYGAHLFNVDMPLNILSAMKGCTHLIVSLPVIPEIGDLMLQHKELVRRELKNGDLKWLCYLSCTSVYGDHGGAWVDEDSTPNPQTEKAKMRLAAEEEWLKIGHDLGLSTSAFRLGEEYGPLISCVRRIMKDGAYTEGMLLDLSKEYTARVHVEDVCQALEANIGKQSDRRLFNIVDDDPTPLGEVLEYAQDLVHKKWPGRMRSTLPLIQERITDKGARISNARMKNELGVTLRYPSYVEGERSVLDRYDKFPF